jgi:hypothetical protein
MESLKCIRYFHLRLFKFTVSCFKIITLIKLAHFHPRVIYLHVVHDYDRLYIYIYI